MDKVIILDITPFFKMMMERNASDLFFSVGAPPHLKVEGQIVPIGQVPLKAAQMDEIARSIMNDQQSKEFDTNMELNMAMSIENSGRFRINVFRQRGQIGIVVRYITQQIPDIESLGLPALLPGLIMEKRGLILVVGATSSGKSTTLASMINHRNNQHNGHILTIEDPIEYLYVHGKSIVDQREIGIDTLSYENALQNAMREAPDVILIGEIRERSTMKHAISYAQTGHLCLSTLHANNANQTMERIINFFPEDAKRQILSDLAQNLRAIISLRLIPGLNSKRVPAVEILINTPHIADLIERGKIDDIKEAISKGSTLGMQTFDQALIKLFNEGKISKENAVNFADSKNNVSLQLRLADTNEMKNDSDLSIQKDEPDPVTY